MVANLDGDEYESFDLDDDLTDDEDELDEDDAASDDDGDGDGDDDDDGDDDGDDDDDDDGDDDDLDDAEPDEIDFVIAAYREDGASVVNALSDDLANDLEELIVQLRRLPGDAGALGFVSLVDEVFVLVRVRGQHVQVLLNDGAAANDWPIAHDVAELLGAEIPDDDEGDPMGDLGLLSDLGLTDFDLSQIADDLDAGSSDMLIDIAERIKIGPQFRRVAEAALS